MGKKSIRDFADLRSLLKKTETEAEAKALVKSAEVSTRRLPKRPVVKPTRQMSATDQFIVDTLAIPVTQLPLNQLHDARLTIQEAAECANNSMLSIQRQLEMTGDHHVDDQGRSWKPRAESALRFKIQEGQELQKKMQLVDELIARAKPALKLVEPPAPPAPPAPAAPYEIRTSVPRPSVRLTSEEWSKYPFDKLETKDHSFRFSPEITANEARRLITAAQRHLSRYFSYRTERDGVIAVWRTDGPSRTTKK